MTFSSVSGLGLKTPKTTEPSKHTPVPIPEPTNAKLPDEHLKEMQKTEVECKALDECLTEHSGKGEDKALKTCVVKHLGEEKGSKVWSIYHKAKIPSKKQVSLAEFKSSRPQSYFKVLRVLKEVLSREGVLLQTDFCAAAAAVGAQEPKAAAAQHEPVPVPAKPDVELPSPGKSHPEHNKNAVDMTPPTCQKLDKCLSQVSSEKYEKEFEKCVSDFCKESYKAHDFKGKDDPRTQLCDKKGKEAWDLIAKAGADVKKNAAKLDVPKEVATQMLLTMAVHSDDMYSKLMKTVFGNGVSLVEMTHKCRM